MPNEPPKPNVSAKKKRVLVKVTDMDSGLELASHQVEMQAGFGSCSSCSSCSNPPDIDPNPF